MNQARFEVVVIELARGSRPDAALTVEVVRARTGLPERDVERMLDLMVARGRLASDVDERVGQVVYRITRDAEREASAVDVIDHEIRAKLATLERELATGAHTAAREVVVKEAVARAQSALTVPGEKSALAAGILGLFLGPFSLLYAAPWLEAVGAIVVYGFAGAIASIRFVGFLFQPVVALMHFACIVASVAYALRFNLHGRRTSLRMPAARDRA